MRDDSDHPGKITAVTKKRRRDRDGGCMWGTQSKSEVSVRKG